MIELSITNELDLMSEPVTDDWEGGFDHIGPVETVTPLVRMLGGKTTCGTITLMSGVLAVGAARLRPFTPVDYLDEMAEAFFAWQHDYRYLDFDAGPQDDTPDEPAALSAALAMRSLFLTSVSEPSDWHSFYQPLMDASHIVNIVNFIMPGAAKKGFKAWLKAASKRLDVIAEIPDLDEPDFSDFESREAYRAYNAPRRGSPLPPDVLNLDVEVDGRDLAAEAAAYVAGLDHTQNRYLRSPDDMLAAGFEGTPYGQPA